MHNHFVSGDLNVPCRMHDLFCLTTIEQCTNADLPVIVAFFKFSAELVTGGVSVVAMVEVKRVQEIPKYLFG